MADDANNGKSKLIDRYNLSGKDDETDSSWKKILTHDGSSNSNVDWYTTKTFQAFLDALDVEKPSNLFSDGRKDNIQKLNLQKKLANISIKSDKIDLSSQNSKSISKDDCKEPEKPPVKKQERNFGEETILCAEALKILSELPDLSHMSATRSFIFPTSNRMKR